MNDETNPTITVIPQTNDVKPVPSVVSPNIVPIQDPNPIKPPSIKKKASNKILKFLNFMASFKLEIKFTYFGSYIAIKLGGLSGFALINKIKGIVMIVNQIF